MLITQTDEVRYRTSCVRSALVLIAHELDRLLETPDLRSWCSDATIDLLQKCMCEKQTAVITRTVVLFARRAAQLASSLSWEEATADA